MPKENIWANVRQFNIGEVPPNLTGDMQSDMLLIFLKDFLAEHSSRQVQFQVQIGWGKDCEHVQLGISAWDHDQGVAVDIPGFYVTLSWSAINRMIKTLRQARDQSFGRPE